MALEELVVQFGVGGLGMYLMFRLADTKLNSLGETQERILLILDKILGKL
ncbi:MAG: hypothetical protein QGI80_02805 [archaeon]|jgi:hypothetical protein|nr:hypothetical protein [archaeon]